MTAEEWMPWPPTGTAMLQARCCGQLRSSTRGVFSDSQVIEAKSLLICSNCQASWLLIGQARTELALVTDTS